MRQRIRYLDVAKFFGIFCIYLGHFGGSAGRGYEFVFSFHVALFFFISGCAETLSSDVPWYKYILKNIKGILIPYYLFAFVSLLILSISTDTHTGIIPNLIIILKGCIRNKYFASGLWFLTCLFVVKIVFYFIRKLLKIKPLIFIVCLSLFVIAEKVISPRPSASPHMVYNIDSACYYIVFYGLGYCCFGFVQQMFTWDRTYKKIICISVGAVCSLYAALLFFGKNLLSYINVTPILSLVCSLLCPIIIITFVFVFSRLFEDVTLFVELGKNTLFLCGSEYTVKVLFPICLQTIGLGASLTNPMSVYLYTFLLLAVCNKTLVPIEKYIFKKLRLM